MEMYGSPNSNDLPSLVEISSAILSVKCEQTDGAEHASLPSVRYDSKAI